MESIARDVKNLESDERRLYESVIGHALQENQRVIIRVIELENEPDEASRRTLLGRAVEIARQGRASVESQGIPAEEADAAIDEAIREARRSKP
ncbi:MAG: hypothetical protein ACYC6Y_09060 [Thermoguttaceae bacterium]